MEENSLLEEQLLYYHANRKENNIKLELESVSSDIEASKEILIRYEKELDYLLETKNRLLKKDTLSDIERVKKAIELVDRRTSLIFDVIERGREFFRDYKKKLVELESEEKEIKEAKEMLDNLLLQIASEKEPEN